MTDERLTMTDIQKLTISLEALQERFTQSENTLLRATRLADSAQQSLDEGDIEASRNFMRQLIHAASDHFCEDVYDPEVHPVAVTRIPPFRQDHADGSE